MPPTATQAPGLSLATAESTRLAALPTGVAAFVGVAEKGPLHRPEVLRGFDEYELVFGGFVEHGHLAESVYTFFLNGGERCWCVRTSTWPGARCRCPTRPHPTWRRPSPRS